MSACCICLDTYTLSGKHRVVSLACGHLFGRICVSKWVSLKKFCPTCHAAAKAKDIRPIVFTESTTSSNQNVLNISIVDNAQDANLQRQLQEERKQRIRLQQENAKLVLQLEKLKDQVKPLKVMAPEKQRTNSDGKHQSCDLVQQRKCDGGKNQSRARSYSNSNAGYQNGKENSSSCHNSTMFICPQKLKKDTANLQDLPRKKRFVSHPGNVTKASDDNACNADTCPYFQQVDTIQVKSGCKSRVGTFMSDETFLYSRSSLETSNPPGMQNMHDICVIHTVNPLSQTVIKNCHSGLIRDIKARSDFIASCAQDKYVKIFVKNTQNLAVKWRLPSPVWCVEWIDDQKLLCGLNDGKIASLDMRKPSHIEQVFSVCSRPIHSIATNICSSKKLFAAGSLASVKLISLRERTEIGKYKITAPNRSTLSHIQSFDKFLVMSWRGKIGTASHVLSDCKPLEYMRNDSERVNCLLPSCHKMYGHSQIRTLSRSCVSNERLCAKRLIISGDERTNKAYVWDISNVSNRRDGEDGCTTISDVSPFSCLHESSNPRTPVLDICSSNSLLITLRSTGVNIFKPTSTNYH